MSWNDLAVSWDERPDVRSYSRAAFQSLQEVLQDRDAPLEGARVLDFGCGTGLLTEALAEHAAEVVALDVSAAMIDVLRAKGLANVKLVLGDVADNLALDCLSEGSFDLITCSSVCGFLDDYPAAVCLLTALLASKGLFVQWDWELDPESEDPMGLSRDAIRSALELAGLRDVTVDVGFRLSLEEHEMAPIRGVGRKP